LFGGCATIQTQLQTIKQLQQNDLDILLALDYQYKKQYKKATKIYTKLYHSTKKDIYLKRAILLGYKSKQYNKVISLANIGIKTFPSLGFPKLGRHKTREPIIPERKTMLINFNLNNKDVTIETRPDRRVVDLLREDFNLTGTKEACGSGECGACTILINGTTKLSCLMLAAQLEGVQVTTIEGLSREDTNRLHPLQEAFIEGGAIQCGFCTPGMVLTAYELLQKNPHP
jgi:carbon-monoxide dehydrogenase small subunit